MSALTADFFLRLLGGMLVNFEIAIWAVVLGLVLGGPLALARLKGGVLAGLAAPVIALMRAAPTFVVMFFLLNIMARDSTLSGVWIVALSMVPYSAAYVADAGVDALRHIKRGSRLGALLFLPNLTRAFFVVVMSSGAAAAIGVVEGISIILRQAERLPDLSDKLVLFAVGIVMFGIPLQLGFAFIRYIQRRLGSRV
jgi:ABC-type arginine transport system permease subunit